MENSKCHYRLGKNGLDSLLKEVRVFQGHSSTLPFQDALAGILQRGDTCFQCGTSAEQTLTFISRYRPKGVFGKGVGNSKNATEMRQKMRHKCVKMGLVLLGKEERSKMRQKCVRIASKMRQKCAEHLWGRTPFGRYRVHFLDSMNLREETKGRFRKRVVWANAPSFQGTSAKVPSFRFWYRGTFECTLVPVFGTGKHPPPKKDQKE